MVTSIQELVMMGGGGPIWYITQPATSLLFQIDVRSFVTGQMVTVYWGDGLSNIYTLSSTVDTAISHVYVVGAVYRIQIKNASCIKWLFSAYDDGRTAWGADMTTWTRLTTLLVTGTNTLTGSVAALMSLTYLGVAGYNTLSGSVAALTSLGTLLVGGYNTLSGSVAALTSLTYLLVTGGLNTITWAVGPLTLLGNLNASDNGLSQAQVDAILLAMYTARATYIATAPVATLGGTNAAPSGVYADEDPPVTGKGMAYELVVDPEGEGYKKWSITFTA